MKYLPQLEIRDCLTTVRTAAICAIAGIALVGCSKHTDNGQAASQAASGQAANSKAPSEPSVTLTAGQITAIKIGSSAPYLFHNQREAVGTVTFAEDPNIYQAEATLVTAVATYAVTETELARAKDLYATKGVSARELDQAISDEQTAEAALHAARDALIVLGKTDAEINAIVASRKIGSSIKQAQESKWVLASAPENDAPAFKVGQPVEVDIEAIPGRKFSGTVAEIYAVADPTVHRVTVRAQVSDPENALRPGMIAEVMIQVADPTESLSIPANGVVREGDGTMTAWVTADRQHFVQKEIDIGMNEDGHVQVLKGLQSGQLVVTDGAVLLDNLLQAPAGDD
jgi:cobalt-zinc-cadmium efflux system membrane fusion protein